MTDSIINLEGLTRIGVVSDTHGRVRPELYPLLDGVEAILHAGDLGSDTIDIELGAVAPFYAVAGNVDGFGDSPHPRWRVFRIGSQRVGMTHVALKGRDLIPSVAEYVRREGIDLLIFGHTHQPLVRQLENGPLLFNPGSCGPTRFSLPVTAGILHVEPDGTVRPELVSVRER